MPPRQRTIALMRWQDRMKAAEIATELGVAEGTVHAHLHSALASWSPGWSGATRSAWTAGREPCDERRSKRTSGP